MKNRKQHPKTEIDLHNKFSILYESDCESDCESDLENIDFEYELIDVNITEVDDINIFDDVLDIDVEKELLAEHNLERTILDLSVPEDIRLKAVQMYEKNTDVLTTNEIINKLLAMYQMSGITVLSSYFYSLCVNTAINNLLKTIIIRIMCYHNIKKGYEALIELFPAFLNDFTSLQIPSKIEMVEYLLKKDEYNKEGTKFFCDLVNHSKIDCDFRYKTIINLESSLVVDKIDSSNIPESVSQIIKTAQLSFLGNNNNMTYYRILAGQYLFRLELDEIEKNNVVEILLSFATDRALDYNLRADASDVILTFGNDTQKIVARNIILELGKQDGEIKTVYHNAQNVHTRGVEESVLETLEYLCGLPVLKIEGKNIDFRYVEKQINNLTKEWENQKEQKEKIDLAMNRIYLDRALYGKSGCTLSTILLKIWSYISNHKYSDEMKVRLLQELEEMSGTCSSGFVSRLINSISGFGEFNMRISWRDQIIANFTGRLNARAREEDDLKYQEQIIEEMMLVGGDYKQRRHFMTFLRRNILPIREGMYEEFREYMDDTTFDLYFRQAVSTYESGDFV